MIAWLIETLVATTLLMLVVLAIRSPVRRTFGASVAYLLWLLPLIRIVLPPLPASWRAAKPALSPIAKASDTITVLVIRPLGIGDTAASAVPHASLGLAIIAVWAAGAAAFFLWHWVAHWRFCRRMLAKAGPSQTAAKGVHVIECAAAAGPLAFGVVRRYVVFPRDFAERYKPDEQLLALEHELGHHARGDLLANWAALAMLAIHWFNPVAWHAFRAFRADQEMANDARVLAGREATFRHAYALAIVKSAHGGIISAACHLDSVHALKGRLKMLTNTHTSRARRVGGMVAIGALILAGLGMTASGTQAAEGLRSSVGSRIGDALAAPVALTTASAAPGIAMSAQHADGGSSEMRTTRSVPPVPPRPPELSAPVTAPPSPPAVSSIPPVPPVPQIPVVNTQAIARQVDTVLAQMPEVSSTTCGAGNARNLVINQHSGGKTRIIICVDRIARVADNFAEIEHNAYRSALSSLQHGRAKLAANGQLAGEARRDALASIDETIKEMHDAIARSGRDD